jgi:hypothetical protein
MRLKHRLKLRILATGLLFSGCTASFELRLSSHELTANGLPTVKKVQGGLEVSVEEFASPNKSRKAFDANVVPHGVLPLLVRVENKGTKDYKVEKNQIRAYLNGRTIPPIYGYEAANQGATRSYAWNALVNTAAIGPLAMFFWPATMALSSNHTKSINRKIEQHFEGLEFTDTILKPDETVAGFVYFKVPEGLKKLENLIVELTVETDGYEEQVGEQRTYKLSIPTLDWSLPAVR